MIILHYSLGFPPYRTGGLTTFCIDLMREQVRKGHKVGLLWPGEIKLFNHRIGIRKGKTVDGIKNYEVVNPLPVPFDEGIKDFRDFCQNGDKQIYDRFLDEIKPDVIHIHTLMGLHKSLLIVAKEKGIRLVFTTHDFFPICPKVTMFRKGKICDSVESCEKCGVCNNTALNLKRIFILQTPVYRKFKDSNIVKKLRKQHRDAYLSGNSDDGIEVGISKDYLRLRNYYFSMIKLMDVIHYNSTITRDIYEKIYGNLNCKIISITHANIIDHKKKRRYDSNCLRIRFLGSQSAAKGYYILKEALDNLWIKRKDFVLDIHFTPSDTSEYMRCHERYTYKDLEDIFDNTDVLICPSIWYETFGYTVLESLSYGVPVIISNTVGAKDIIKIGAGIVIDSITPDKIYQTINEITRSGLEKANKIIVNEQDIMTISDMARQIETEVYGG